MSHGTLVRLAFVFFASFAAISLVTAADPPLVFRDVATEAGILPAAAGIQGHSAGWGDVDGDGWLDLYVGTFGRLDGKTNMLFRNQQGKFTVDPQPATALRGRSNSSLFVDLDDDGDLDLYVASMPQPKQNAVGCRLLRNDGGGKFTDVSSDNGACPAEFGGRSAAALDFDGDGRLDLLVGEDPIVGYNGSKTKSSRLFRNLGDLRFADVSAERGLTADIPGLGVAAGDVNDDGWPDFFLASGRGGNRLFLNDGQGRFAEHTEARETFDWGRVEPKPTGDDTPSGVALGDVDGDGLVDIAIGHHYSSPWKSPVFNRLYRNTGIRDGKPTFVDVTEASGLKRLPMKAPHVDLQDFDNDGRPDLLTSLVKFADGRAYPLVFRNVGSRGAPRFTEDVLGKNDFPTDEDRAVRKTGEFFDKMLRDRKVIYSAPAPVGDFDRDGRLDIFLANWWENSPSMLLRNETSGGRWLDVSVRGSAPTNRMGIGAVVRVYAAGKLGDPESLVGRREITASQGYVSGNEAAAHFGLGRHERVDVEVTWPHGAGKSVERGVAADRRLTIAR